MTVISVVVHWCCTCIPLTRNRNKQGKAWRLPKWRPLENCCWGATTKKTQLNCSNAAELGSWHGRSTHYAVLLQLIVFFFFFFFVTGPSSSLKRLKLCAFQLEKKKKRVDCSMHSKGLILFFFSHLSTHRISLLKRKQKKKTHKIILA